MGGKTTYHHGDLKKALIDGAIALIDEKDVPSLSLREVARRVGVSHTAPYRHFEDKDALLAAVAEEGFIELTQGMKQAIARIPNQPMKRLETSGVAYVQYAIAHPAHYRVMFGPYSGDREKYPSLAEAGERAFGVLVSSIIEGQSAGDICGGNPQELAQVAWSLVHGLAMLLIDGRLCASKPEESEALACFAAQRLLEGLATSREKNKIGD